MAWFVSTRICNNSYYPLFESKNTVTKMRITPKDNIIRHNSLNIRIIDNLYYI